MVKVHLKVYEIEPSKTITGICGIGLIDCHVCLHAGVDGGCLGTGPLERVPREEHVPDQGLYRGLPDQANKEQLFYHRGGDSSEGGEAEEEFAEPGGLVRVLGSAVLLQGALRLLLQLLDKARVGETTGVCNRRNY